MRFASITALTVYACLCSLASAFMLPSSSAGVVLKLRNGNLPQRRNTALGLTKMSLVSYGDVWNVVEETNAKQRHQKRRGFGRGSTTFRPRAFAAHAATALGTAAAGILASLIRKPSEDEIRENMRLWAQQRNGAVLPPLDDEELSNQVKYVGVFPELVEQMMEAQLQADDAAL